VQGFDELHLWRAAEHRQVHRVVRRCPEIRLHLDHVGAVLPDPPGRSVTRAPHRHRLADVVDDHGDLPDHAAGGGDEWNPGEPHAHRSTALLISKESPACWRSSRARSLNRRPPRADSGVTVALPAVRRVKSLPAISCGAGSAAHARSTVYPPVRCLAWMADVSQCREPRTASRTELSARVSGKFRLKTTPSTRA